MANSHWLYDFMGFGAKGRSVLDGWIAFSLETGYPLDLRSSREAENIFIISQNSNKCYINKPFSSS